MVFVSSYPDLEAITCVVVLLYSDPLTEVAVRGQHSVGVESLDNVDGAINTNGQQASRYNEHQHL